MKSQVRQEPYPFNVMVPVHIPWRLKVRGFESDLKEVARGTKYSVKRLKKSKEDKPVYEIREHDNVIAELRLNGKKYYDAYFVFSRRGEETYSLTIADKFLEGLFSWNN